jgi:hypothetical protein
VADFGAGMQQIKRRPGGQVKDLVGQEFGNLTVIQRVPGTLGRSARWLCQCKCGKARLAYGDNLKCGDVKNCPDCSHPVKDLTGQRFGKLVVISFVSKGTRKSSPKWLCHCDCGNEKVIAANNLNSGNVRSCSCLSRLEVGLAAKRRVFKEYEKHAIEHNRDFSIDFDSFISICTKPCFYCGANPARSMKKSARKATFNGDFLCNGVDRVDNDEGYTILNSVSCCRICNWMKRHLTKHEFLSHIERVFTHSCAQNSVP